jgi:hypothetical protein
VFCLCKMFKDAEMKCWNPLPGTAEGEGTFSASAWDDTFHLRAEDVLTTVQELAHGLRRCTNMHSFE